MRDYFQSSLALEWRSWLTRRITADYFSDRAFYQIQAGELVDNPDQRIASDVRLISQREINLGGRDGEGGGGVGGGGIRLLTSFINCSPMPRKSKEVMVIRNTVAVR